MASSRNYVLDFPDQRQKGFKDQSSRNRNIIEDEDRGSSREEIRKKSKELHHFLKYHQNGKRNGEIPQVIPFVSNLKHDSTALKDSLTTSKNPHTRNKHGNVTNLNTNKRSDLNSMTKKRSESNPVRRKEVELVPDLSRLSGNETDGIELCHKLFGIVLFQLSNGSIRRQRGTSQSRLLVQSVVDKSAVQTSGKIQRGDLLINVNDKTVTQLNLFKVLSSIRKREIVKLSFQCPLSVGPKSYQILKVPPSNDLCVTLLGRRLDSVLQELSQFPCLLLYLTFDSPSHSESEIDLKEDIIYAFPGDEERLTSIRGLFITLTATVADAIGQAAFSSCVTLPESSVGVVYHACGRDVLILALPEGCMSTFGRMHLLDAIQSLMVLLYGDVRSAFLNADRMWLDKVMAVFMYNALGLEPLTPSPTDPSISPHQQPGSRDASMLFCHQMPVSTVCRFWSVKDLPLSSENKLICDEILSEFESMDFDNLLSQEELSAPRKYVILGCSLYFKDYLLRSHIPAQCQRDVNLYLNSHGLLSLSARTVVDTVFVWQEVKTCSHYTAATLPGYTPAPARHFLMVIGLHHYLLAVWLEARGFPSVSQEVMQPQQLLIDQGKATLAQLETQEVHMTQCCMERLNGHSNSIRLAMADQLCVQSLSTRRRLHSNDMRPLRGVGTPGRSGPSRAVHEGFLKSRSKSVDRLGELEENVADSSFSVIKRQGSKISFESNDSAGSGSSVGHKGKSSSVSSLGDGSSNLPKHMSYLSMVEPSQRHRTVRICRGKETALLYYMSFDLLEGILVCPSRSDVDSVLSPLQQDVLYNFHVSCQRMSHAFSTSAQTPQGKTDTQPAHDGDVGPNVSKAAQSVSCMFTREKEPYVEQGVLFTCSIEAQEGDRKSSTLNLEYWVVGRRQTSPSAKEIYVCFNASAYQEIVEVAFSLGFGYDS